MNQNDSSFFGDTEFDSAVASDLAWEAVGVSTLTLEALRPTAGDVNTFLPEFSAAADVFVTTTHSVEPNENLEFKEGGNVSQMMADAPMEYMSNRETAAQNSCRKDVICQNMSTTENVTRPTGNTYIPPSVIPLDNFGAPTSVSVNSSCRSSKEDLENNNNSTLRLWEKTHEEELEKKREEEDQFREERRKEAQKHLSEWYKERENRLQKVRQSNRTNESQESKLHKKNSTTLQNNSQESWNRVYQLVECTTDATFSQAPASSKLAMQEKSAVVGKNKSTQNFNGTNSSSPKQPSQQFTLTKDTSRMQQLLLQLKSGSTSFSSDQLANGLVSH